MPDGFLCSWVATYVKPVPAEERAERIAKWAAECVADAMMAGIPFDDIHKAAGGNVQTYIARAADYLAKREAQPTDEPLERPGASA